MRNFVLALSLLVTMCVGAHPAFAGVQVFDDTTNVGVFSKIKCTKAGGLSCTKSGDTLNLTARRTPVTAAERTIYGHGWLAAGTSTATLISAGTTTSYMTQIRIPAAITVTGVKVLNGTTTGTDKRIAALFSSAGAVLASSAGTGTTTGTAGTYTTHAFTTAYAVTAPGTYWIGVYQNGTTDTLYAIPAIGQAGGLAGSVTGQVFGTVSALTVPTTFTADKGPVAFVY